MTTAQQIDLLPCPICGKAPTFKREIRIIEINHRPVQAPSGWIAHCCDVFTNFAAWNQYAAESPQVGLLDSEIKLQQRCELSVSQAAPELLAMLQEIIAAWDDNNAFRGNPIDKARKLVARLATGQQPRPETCTNPNDSI